MLLNKALCREPENKDALDARTVCEKVTCSGMQAHQEILEVMNAYNVLYGFDGTDLISGVQIAAGIAHPEVPSVITREKVLEAFYKVNSYKTCDHRLQVDYLASWATLDMNPEETTYIFLDDVGTPRQKDIRQSANHEAVPRESKRVWTTNAVILSKEGIYYLSASDTAEMCLMIRGFMLMNHLLENRDLVCFSDGAKLIWTNYDKWFSFRPHRIFADWYHLKNKSNELFSRILTGGKKYKDEIYQIKQEYFGILWTGNIARAIQFLYSIDDKYLKRGRSVGLLADYLKNKQEHHIIPVFAMRKQMHQVNASSRAETANCSMTTSRQKKQGKSWSPDGSHAKTTWRNLFANNEAVPFLKHENLAFKPIPISRDSLEVTEEDLFDAQEPDTYVS